MNLETILKDVLDKKIINTISKQSGLNGTDTKNAITKALPLLLGGLQKKAESKGLKKAIEEKHTSIPNLSDGIDLEDGKKILGHIFGEKTKEIEKKSGNPEILKALGPIVLGAIGKAKNSGKLDLGNLSEVLGGSINSQKLLTSFLDKDGDGDIKDDIFTMIINFIKNNFLGKKK